MINFFLLTRGRTGSTAVLDELNKTGILCATQELFLAYTDPGNAKGANLEACKLISPYDLWKIGTWKRKLLLKIGLEKVLASHYLAKAEHAAQLANNARGFGFKVLSNNLVERSFLLATLIQRDYKAIYLTRNVASQVISGMIANQRGIYNSKKEVDDTHRYLIDLDKFKQLVSWEKKCVESDCALLKERGFKFLIVSYEEFCEDRQSFFSRIFNFLELPNVIPDASDYTIMIKDVAYTIENYAEVARCADALGFSLS